MMRESSTLGRLLIGATVLGLVACSDDNGVGDLGHDVGGDVTLDASADSGDPDLAADSAADVAPDQVADGAGESAGDTGSDIGVFEGLWIKAIGDVDYDQGRAVVVDGSGRILVAGYFSGAVDFGGGAVTSAGGTDGFIAAYESSGAHVWSRAVGGIGGDSIEDITVDGSGNIYVAGSFADSIDFGDGTRTSAGGAEAFVASYDGGGVFRWVHTAGGAGMDNGNAVAVDADGYVYAGGRFHGSADFGGGVKTAVGKLDMFLVALDAAGGHRWSKTGGSGEYDNGLAVATDASGNVYGVGYVGGVVDLGGGDLAHAGGNDAFIASYARDGTHRWSKTFGGTAGDYANDVSVGPSGHVYITGFFRETATIGGSSLTSAGENDVYVASLDASGGDRWGVRLGGSAHDTGLSLAIDGSGRAFVAGHFQGSVDFGAGHQLTAASGYDAFVAGLDSSGALFWATSIGSPAEDYGYGVATTAAGVVYATGTHEGVVDFGSTTLPNAGGFDIFVAAYQP